jgi:DNA-binding transcriptional MerR regulator
MTDHLASLGRLLARRGADGGRVYSPEDVERLSRQLLFVLLDAQDEPPPVLVQACNRAALELGFRADDPPARLAELLDQDISSARDADGLRAELTRFLQDLVSGALTPTLDQGALAFIGGEATSRPLSRKKNGVGGGPLARALLQDQLGGRDDEDQGR